MSDLLRHLGLELAYANYFLVFVLIMSRMIPCVTMAPFLGGKSTPNEVKMVLIVMMVLVVYPSAYRTLNGTVPQDPMPFLVLMLKEIFLGLTMGIVTNHVFYAVEIMGRIVDTARGSNMAEVMVPQMEGRATPIGDLYYQYTICLVFALGGHRIYIDTVASSFLTFPLLKPILWLDVGLRSYVDALMHVSSHILLIAISLALPAAAATFIVDVVFGLLNRVAPQLNAYFMAMPVKAMGGLAVLLVSTSMIATELEHVLADMLNEVSSALNYLAFG